MSGGHRPRLGFAVAGAQKCGTSALRAYLRQHPQIGMAAEEEVHLFDAVDFAPCWTPAEIDRRYARSFRHCQGAEILGEVTPIYMFLPEVAAAVKHYNPNLKLIVLLRDRTERAISHYYMEKARGNESKPLWWALLAESWRIRRCREPRRQRSALRVCSYRRRGLYSQQVRNLYRHFPSDQVLIIRSQDLRNDHQAVLRRVFAFLGVAEDVAMAPQVVHAGEYDRRDHPFLSWLLWLGYAAERRRSRAMGLPC